MSQFGSLAAAALTLAFAAGQAPAQSAGRALAADIDPLTGPRAVTLYSPKVAAGGDADHQGRIAQLAAIRKRH